MCGGGRSKLKRQIQLQEFAPLLDLVNSLELYEHVQVIAVFLVHLSEDLILVVVPKHFFE